MVMVSTRISEYEKKMKLLKNISRQDQVYPFNDTIVTDRFVSDIPFWKKHRQNMDPYTCIKHNITNSTLHNKWEYCQIVDPRGENPQDDDIAKLWNPGNLYSAGIHNLAMSSP